MDLGSAIPEPMKLQQHSLSKRDEGVGLLVSLESQAQLVDGSVKLPPLERMAYRRAGSNQQERQQPHHERRHLPKLRRR